jgi:hypothetical protein
VSTSPEHLLVTDNDKASSGPSDGDTEASGVSEEAHFAVIIGPCAREDHNVCFLPLKRVDGTNTDAASVPLQRQFGPDKLNLLRVGADDGNVGFFYIT